MNSITGMDPNPIDPEKSFSIPLHGDKEITFTAQDPFGFLDGVMSDGSTPDEFKGSFTSPKHCRLAVNAYLARNPEVTITGPKIV